MDFVCSQSKMDAFSRVLTAGRKLCQEWKVKRRFFANQLHPQAISPITRRQTTCHHKLWSCSAGGPFALAVGLASERFPPPAKRRKPSLSLAIGLGCATTDASWKHANTSGNESTPLVHSSYEREPDLSMSITSSNCYSSFTCSATCSYLSPQPLTVATRRSRGETFPLCMWGGGRGSAEPRR